MRSREDEEVIHNQMSWRLQHDVNFSAEKRHKSQSEIEHKKSAQNFSNFSILMKIISVGEKNMRMKMWIL